MPFESLHLDTKYLLDKSVLPLDVYEHMKEKGLPQYEWNNSFSHLDVSLYPIPPGAKYLNALVENTHRADDEYFLIIHAEICSDTKTFMDKPQMWQDTWNYYRASYGIAMNGMTPQKKCYQKRC